MIMQKSVTFINKNLKANTWKIKKYRRVRNHCYYTGENRGTPHSISTSDSNYTVPKKILIGFYNWYSYYYHYIIKELAEELKKIICLGGNAEKYIIFKVPIGKEVTTIEKNGEKITINISYILQFIDTFWQRHYQMLLIIFLNEFIKLNLNIDMMIKNAKFAKISISIVSVFLNI